MKNKKLGNFVAILIAVIIVLIIVVGFYLYKEESGHGVPPPTISPVSEATTSIPVALPDWKTYTDERSGSYTISYPEGWWAQNMVPDFELVQSGNPTSWIHIQNNLEPFPSASDPWKSASFVDIKTFNVSAGTMLTSYVDANMIKTITIGGVKYDAGIPSDAPYDVTSTKNGEASVYIIKDYYKIGQVVNIGNGDRDKLVRIKKGEILD